MKSRLWRAILLISSISIYSVSNAATCGKPAFDPSEIAAIYIWHDCETSNWHLRATAGGDYARFQGRLFTDGVLTAVVPVQLGEADSLSVQDNQIDFHLQIWSNNFDGIDFTLSVGSKLDIDITGSTHNSVFVGETKELIEQFPATIGGHDGSGGIGDFIWDDVNADGTQDTGEPGLSDVVVQLLDCGGTLLGTTTSNSDGGYLFQGLAVGSYRMRFIAPAGYDFSPARQGTNRGLDSNPDPATGTGECLPLADGQQRLGIDAGLIAADGPGGGIRPTVNTQTTNDSTPIITGTFDAVSTITLTVTVDGVIYTLGIAMELTNLGDTWTLDLSTITPLADGTYDVSTTATDAMGNSISDITSNELVIDSTDPTAKLNFIFILSDDQRFDTLWAMPNLQTYMIDEGVLFENAVVTSPLCCPARASILSGGLYDKNTGVYSNELPTGSFALFNDTQNLGTALQKAGYRTGLIGKIMNGYPVGYVLPGWSTFIGNRGPGQDNWNSFKATVGSSNETSTTGEIIGPINQYITDYHRDRSLDFISEDSDKPFFLLLSSYAPHAPATPASSDAALFNDFLYRGRGYTETDLSDKPRWVRDPSMALIVKTPLDDFPTQQLRSLQALDRSIKAIIDRLAEINKLNNTVVVYASDNGFMWGEHGIWRKTHEFEESIRVPLVIRYPGIPPRVETKQVAVDIDVPATVLDLANSNFRTDGISLIPLLHQTDTPWRNSLLLNMYHHYQPHRIWAGIRTERWKYFENATGDQQLYDLLVDPFELESKHADPDFADIKNSLKDILDREKGLSFTKLPAPNLVVGQPFQLTLKAWGGQLPYTWEVEDNAPLIYLGNERWLISGSDLPFTLSTSIPCGKPNFDSSIESAIFAWRDCSSGIWQLRATAGGDYAKYVGTLTSDLPLLDLVPYNINTSSDSLTYTDLTQIEFMMQIWNTGVNGFDFLPAAGATVKLDIDTNGLPRGLTLDTNSGVISGIPENAGQRVVRITVKDQSQRKIDGGPQKISMDMSISVR